MCVCVSIDAGYCQRVEGAGRLREVVRRVAPLGDDEVLDDAEFIRIAAGALLPPIGSS